MKIPKYILGINGLGVSPSACLLKDGQVVAMAEEERFNRLKNSFGLMPSLASKYCLDLENLNLSDIEAITFSWDCNFYKYKMPLFLLQQYLFRSPTIQNSSNISKVISELIKYQKGNVERLIKEMFATQFLKGPLPPIYFVEHHVSHASSSYFTSGFKDAYILVLDGSGENKTTSIWKGENNKLKEIKSYKIPDSLGWFYQCITEFLGFTPNSHEGKTMALAAYGEEDLTLLNKFNQIIHFDDEGNYRFNVKFAFGGNRVNGNIYSKELENLLGKPRHPSEEITQYHKNIALQAQKFLEIIVLKIVKNLSKNNDFNGNLCLAGGIALNCKLLGEIENLNEIKNLFVPPFPNDAGTSYGAAIFKYTEQNSFIFDNHSLPYCGPSFTDNEIETLLNNFKVSYSKVSDISKEVAKLISENKIVAWFQGRMEIGARALGARSILANPLQENAREIINKRIKHRENWRPFAAAILKEDQNYFTDSPNNSPYMGIAFKFNCESANLIPAAIHIDNTCRAQFIQEKDNPLFWALIKHFKELTGVGAILNTSFNGNEEPIVCSPKEALRSFLVSNLDYLAMGSYLISKNKEDE